MKINQDWLDKQKDGDNPYVSAIIKVGEKVLDLMEELGDKEIVADKLISKADEELKEDITGNMAAYVALIAIKCHSRGEEFRKSWNKYYGQESSKGVVNPAILNI